MSLFAPPNYPGTLHDPAGLQRSKPSRKSAEPVPAAAVQHPLEGVVDGPRTQTTSPLVTGTSVLAIRYKDGVALAADTLASYGSLARYRDIRRLHSIGPFTIVGASGELSDYQYLLEELQAMVTNDYTTDDGAAMNPKEIHSWLTRILYERRSRFNPLWNQLAVAGYRDGKSFLGMADLYGTSYLDDTVATGYGAYITRGLLRNAVERAPGGAAGLSEEQARQILEDSLRVLFYRDARASSRVQIATISAKGSVIGEPFELRTDWEFGRRIHGH